MALQTIVVEAMGGGRLCSISANYGVSIRIHFFETRIYFYGRVCIFTKTYLFLWKRIYFNARIYLFCANVSIFA